jgi:hypothetical protein
MPNINYEGNRSSIHPEDIMEEYMKFPEPLKCAVTNLRGSVAFMLGTVIDKTREENEDLPYDTTADWVCGPNESIALVLNFILIGQRTYGEVWVEELFRRYQKLSTNQ